MRAGYVKRRVTEVSADRYEITDLVPKLSATLWPEPPS
jgi:hypothetical protein